MKFLGIQLDDIKRDQDDYRTIDSVKQLFSEKSKTMEAEFNELLRHFTALKNLAATTRDDDSIDWSRYARIIQDFEDGGKYFWQLSCVYEENASREVEAAVQRNIEEKQRHHEKMRAMHELIAQAIVLMHDGVPADDERAQELARKFNSIQDKTGWAMPVNHFILGDAHSSHSGDHAHTNHHASDSMPPSLAEANTSPFGELRNDVGAYFLKASQALQKQQKRKEL